MPKPSTQDFLELEEIKEGVIILKNKSLRGVLMVSSLNFALKSDEEQSAIIYQFQNFLNSLDFSTEIVIQSRILNLTGYLDKLREVEKKQKNELMKIQAADYIKFIEELVNSREILVKNFFVVVPFAIINTPKFSTEKKVKFTEEEFKRGRSQLWQRMEFVATGLRGCGLESNFLDSLGLIELFWSLYHPEHAEKGYYPELPPEIIK